jgi:hypothetical protein
MKQRTLDTDMDGNILPGTEGTTDYKMNGIFWDCGCGAKSNSVLSSCWKCGKFMQEDIDLIKGLKK